jgi:hypothetical protein
MMRVIQWLTGIFFCLQGRSQPVHAVSENVYITAGAYSIHFKDAFSFLANPACLGTISNFSGGILAERKWMLEELAHYEAALSFPVVKGGWGIGLQYSGDAGFSEKAVELAYGKYLGRLELGIRFNYLRAEAAGYSATGFGSSGIGLLFQVSEKLVTGWELGLPVFGRAGKTNPEKSPSYFRMGFGYEWRTDVYLAFRVLKTQGLPVNLISSIEYRYGEQFFFSFGISSLAGSVYFKSGWEKNQLRIEISTVYEPVLGFSPGLLLLWESKNKKG